MRNPWLRKVNIILPSDFCCTGRFKWARVSRKELPKATQVDWMHTGSGGGSVRSTKDDSGFYFLGQASGQKQKKIQLLETWFLNFRVLINGSGWGSRDGKICEWKAICQEWFISRWALIFCSETREIGDLLLQPALGKERGVAACLFSDPALLGFKTNHPNESIY